MMTICEYLVGEGVSLDGSLIDYKDLNYYIQEGGLCSTGASRVFQ